MCCLLVARLLGLCPLRSFLDRHVCCPTCGSLDTLLPERSRLETTLNAALRKDQIGGASGDGSGPVGLGRMRGRRRKEKGTASGSSSDDDEEGGGVDGSWSRDDVMSYCLMCGTGSEEWTWCDLCSRSSDG